MGPRLIGRGFKFYRVADCSVEIDKKIYGFVNSDITAEAKYTIPAGKYSVVVNKDAAGTKEIKEINGGEITVEKASSLIIIKK